MRKSIFYIFFSVFSMYRWNAVSSLCLNLVLPWDFCSIQCMQLSTNTHTQNYKSTAQVKRSSRFLKTFVKISNTYLHFLVYYKSTSKASRSTPFQFINQVNFKSFLIFHMLVKFWRVDLFCFNYLNSVTYRMFNFYNYYW